MILTGQSRERAVALRAQALAALFDDIARSRMAGLPVMHAGLRVEAIGFRPEPAGEPGSAPGATGILVTPWFMNLVWIPVLRHDAPALIGATRSRQIGGEQFAFTSAHEDRFGAFEACSMFSPMFGFGTQAEACATASALLAQLRARTPQRSNHEDLPIGARRSFLFGRGTARERAS